MHRSQSFELCQQGLNMHAFSITEKSPMDSNIARHFPTHLLQFMFLKDSFSLSSVLG